MQKKGRSRQRQHVPQCRLALRFSPRFATPLFAFFMSAVMTAIISGILTAYDVGLGSNFIGAWASRFVLGWALALPIAISVAPLIRSIVA
ncbi:DUF2798 domain-containing protein [Sinorhizobium meliloti]|uniref:DUF2798 domain-containing protein n=1 Tax=Rhizobium meliloti TaxID=382 RepID=UPI000FDC78E9|nr:DUF2798 domain-containing protein [Sinorhizobium meliloti]RVK27621.1 DUF2798 domain-containing protein [Sinorhizobium meliloti]